MTKLSTLLIGTFVLGAVACDTGVEVESGEFRDEAAMYEDELEFTADDEFAGEDAEQGLADDEFDVALEDEELEYLEGELMGEAGPGATDDIAWGVDTQQGCSRYKGVGSANKCWAGYPSTSTKKRECSRRFGGTPGCYRVGRTRKTSWACFTWGCYKNPCC